MNTTLATERLQELVAEAPDALRLARLASLAVRVERHLLRRLRLDLLPGADVGSEADLWFSPIIESRGSSSFVIDSTVALLLRADLAREPETFERAVRITEFEHRHMPASIRLEEQLHVIAARGGNDVLARIDEAMAPALRALREDERAKEVARWAMRALPRFDPVVRKSGAALALLLRASGLLGGRRIVRERTSSQAALNQFAWAIPAAALSKRARIALEVTDTAVRFVEDRGNAPVLELPRTTPLLVEVSWASSDARTVNLIEAEVGNAFQIDSGVKAITLRALDGSEFLLQKQPAEQPRRAENPKYAPMGGNLSANGATFKVWAPGAQGVYLNGTFGGNNRWAQDTDPDLLLQKDSAGYWSGFMPGAGEGDPYKFYVVGTGSRGYKRDPYARELSFDPPFPSANCLLRNPGLYPWHDQGFVTPDYSNMIIYQLHVGTFYSNRPGEDGTFLDVVEKIEYLAALGITVLELLPIDEFETQTSQGYNGSDLFSPETRYGVSDQARLAEYLATVNRLLVQKQEAPLTIQDLMPVPNQLKALVDLCHLYGIAVVFDVVYNHAGGFDGDDESLYFWDRGSGDNDSSLYFTSQGWAGGLSFALWKQEVRQFLIDNAAYFQQEFHVDGFRYDEVSVLVALNQDYGRSFCQNLTNTVRSRHDRAIQIAEFWPVNPNIVKSTAANGEGFDVTEHDALHLAVRQAIGQAEGSGSTHVDMDRIAAALNLPGFPEAWRAVSCVENHYEVFAGRSPRIPHLADSSYTRSFYARSRSRMATGLLLTAPGIPQLFMGQEFLEDKQWSDDPGEPNRIWWEGLTTDKSSLDFLRFVQDLIQLRCNQPAICRGSIRVFHVHNQRRILAFHRWLEKEGPDVVVVVSLNDRSQYNYSIGFPHAGRWAEIFNSDVYDNWVNPSVTNNGGQIFANGGPMHGCTNSAAIAIPPNSIVVFGD